MNDPTLFPGGVGEPTPAPKLYRGPARLQLPNREQVLLVPSDLDSMLPCDHRARLVWDYVKGLDLAPFYARILAVVGEAGRPPIDPAILMTLWLYATLESVGSARELERLCEAHDAYRWICGGVGVNHHTLSDFRSGNGEQLDRILSESVAALMKEGLVDLDRVAQDGIRVRAEAGSASFRRQESLEDMLKAAEERVKTLRTSVDDLPRTTSKRQFAAQQRAARERTVSVRRALANRAEVEAIKRKKGNGGEAAEKARASTTDPEARIMKMPDGGCRAAYNGQFATATGSQVIVGVDVTNQGNDAGWLGKMNEQIEGRYGRRPRESLADSGFVNYADIEREGLRGTLAYTPVPGRASDKRGSYEVHETDTPVVAKWRERMGTPEAQKIYRERASTAECVNAQARNRGLRRTFVRGLNKVRSILLWFALAHNCLRAAALRRGALAAA